MSYTELTPYGSTTYICTSDRFDDLVQAVTFHVLMDLASPFVTRYRSDFFRDAQWIAKYVTGPTEFWFGFGECGTHIGEDEELITGFSEHVVNVMVTQSAKGKWDVVLDAAKGDPFRKESDAALVS